MTRRCDDFREGAESLLEAGAEDEAVGRGRLPQELPLTAAEDLGDRVQVRRGRGRSARPRASLQVMEDFRAWARREIES